MLTYFWRTQFLALVAMSLPQAALCAGFEARRIIRQFAL